MPSDHFIYPEELFLRTLWDSVRVGEALDRVVLLGAQPHTLDVEFGWIRRGVPLSRDGRDTVHHVESFVEKPGGDLAAAMRALGGLWSTMVLAASLRRLWALGHQHLSEMMAPFEGLVEGIGTRREGAVLEAI